jgi:DNA-binding CsgD family transcriptional regulator
MTEKFCLEDVLDAMAVAPTLSDMRELLLQVREAYGLTNIVYHGVKLSGWDSPRPLLLLSYEPEWLGRYASENYFEIDPVHAHATSSFLPLDWSQIDRRGKAVSHFFKDAERHDVGRHGVTIPVRGPNGERALFTVTSNVSEDEWNEKRFAFIRDYHALAHFFHDRAAYLVGARQGKVTLSHRETECVQLLASGLQPKNIAHNLGISESAVRLYTKSARHKLRCSTLAQMIAEAARHEII